MDKHFSFFISIVILIILFCSINGHVCRHIDGFVIVIERYCVGWRNFVSLLSSFLFVVVIDVVSELAKESVLDELLYADDLS